MKKTSWLLLLIPVSILVLGGLYWRAKPVVSGGLNWKTSRQTHRLQAGDEKFAFEFAFKNTTRTPVTIKSVTPDCSCVSSSFAETRYAPGQSGEIPFTFTVGSRYGKIQKTVQVVTDASPQPVLLELVFDVPVVLDIAPRLLFWKKGGPNDARKIKISAADHPYRILRVTAVNRAFQSEIHTVVENREFEIVVKPADTQTARSSELIIQTDCPYAAWSHIVCQLRVE